MKQASESHLGFLDGVRGLAALWVVIGHCMIGSGSHWHRFPHPITAVDVFMLVSGYLMVHQWTRRVGTGASVPSWAAAEFWIRRTFRIVPVFWLVLLVTVIWHRELTEWLNTIPTFRRDTGVVYDPNLFPTDALSVFLRATFLFGFIPKLVASPFMGDWSLALEMQFYAAFPLLIMLLRRRGVTTIILGAVVLAWIARELVDLLPEVRPGAGTSLPMPTLLPLRLPVFLVGMVIAEANRQFAAAPLRRSLEVALALVVAAMQAWQVAAVAALAFLAGAGRKDPGTLAGRSGAAWADLLLGGRLMRFLADCSYSVYLLHSLAIVVWAGWLWRQDWFLAWRGGVRMGVLFLLVCASAYPLAWLIHQLVEKPGIELGRRVIRRLWPHPERPAAAVPPPATG